MRAPLAACSAALSVALVLAMVSTAAATEHPSPSVPAPVVAVVPAPLRGVPTTPAAPEGAAAEPWTMTRAAPTAAHPDA